MRGNGRPSATPALFPAVCNLYSITKGQAVIREATRAIVDGTGNQPPLPVVVSLLRPVSEAI